MKNKLLLASVCLCSNDQKDRNIEEALRLVRYAAERGADWVALPEVFTYHGPYEEIYAKGEADSGALVKRLSETARDLNICLFAGSFGERPEYEAKLPGRLGHDRVYNTCYVFGRDGQQVAKYRKTHLFNLYDEQGQALYCESDGFLQGDQLVSFELEGFRVGLAICYDLRFPAFFEALAKDKALDLIVLPAAFTLQTGMDHWELLLRARAVEQQCYVLAPNQYGNHGRGKMSYGHSMIIDPWGYILANTGAVAGVAFAEMTRERIVDVRNKLPALRNKRPEIYV